MQETQSRPARAEMLSLRVTRPQAAFYKAVAASEGMSLSEWLRKAATARATAVAQQTER
jgi:uncharacterized protein (DUF1778 family)